MSTTYRISEVAERTGFSRPTIRYYEEIGLVPAASRLASGYRVYDDRSLDRLSFISRAKRLGLSLDEVRELAVIWDQDECAPVQKRMAGLVAERLTETQDRIAELVTFGAQLQAVASRLTEAAHPGPCDDTCACAAAPATAKGAPLPLTRAAVPAGAAVAEPISCSLDAGEMDGRMNDWQALLGLVIDRTPVTDGISLSFSPEPGVAAQVARLAAAEQACCSFFDFTVRVSGGELRLEVRGPQDAQGIISALFGVEGGGAARGPISRRGRASDFPRRRLRSTPAPA
jgi:DNA-binding transcriptional MerR regulator